MMDIAEITGGGVNSEEAINGAPSGDFAIIEAGWYPADIGDVEPRENSKKTGYVVKVKATILGDKHSGRVVFGDHNIKNPSAKSQAIGLAHVGQLGKAFGIANVTTVDELRGACQIHVKVKAGEPEKGYPEPSNQIDGYLAAGAPLPKSRGKAEATPPPVPPAATQQSLPVETSAQQTEPAAAPAVKGKMPWMK